MNTVYTFEIARPVAERAVDTDPDDKRDPDPKGDLLKTIVEGKLHNIISDSDGSSRSIFVDCTLHHYYSNLTVPIIFKNELYSVPTSWINKI
jgi:hypothetical protein